MIRCPCGKIASTQPEPAAVIGVDPAWYEREDVRRWTLYLQAISSGYTSLQAENMVMRYMEENPNETF